jgi:hypothetical protein
MTMVVVLEHKSVVGVGVGVQSVSRPLNGSGICGANIKGGASVYVYVLFNIQR